MLTPYFFSIKMAVMTFLAVAALIALPYAVYNYRKYGSVSPWRTVVLFSFVLYLLCAYYLVILPLPDPAAVAQYTSAQFDWLPFHFIVEISDSAFDPAEPATWLPFLKSMDFLEPFFNVMLLMPFGVYLAYYFKQNWKKCLLAAFFLSFFFEMTQLSGLYGIYPRPYRLFSTDDLMLNSLGGMVGYLIFAKVQRFLPGKEQLDRKAVRRSGEVGFARRLAAMLVDSLILIILQGLLDGIFHFELDSMYLSMIFVCVYGIGFSLLTGGRTPGKALVRIKLKVASLQPSSFALAMARRWLLREAVFFALSMLNELIGKNDALQPLWLALFCLVVLFSLADMVYSLRKDKMLWYERFSRTKNVSTFKAKEKASIALYKRSEA